MPLFLSDEQVQLQDTARPFLAEQAPISHMRALRDGHDPTGFSPALWQRFGDMGFAGILIDDQHGGLGLGHVEAGIVLEEIGRNLTQSPFLATSVGAVTALHAAAGAMRAALAARNRRRQIRRRAGDRRNRPSPPGSHRTPRGTVG